MSANSNNISKIKFIAHKVLPLVYDDSLSYYEFLCKVMNKLNEVIDEIDEANERIDDTEDDIATLLTDVIDNTQKIGNLISWKTDLVVQTTGQSETKVMSQKAVTDELSDIEDEIDSLGDDIIDNTRNIGNIIEQLSELIVQTTGQSTTTAMSQKAVTDSIQNISDEIDGIVVSSTGQSTTKAMSQKAVTDELNDIKEQIASINEFLNNLIVQTTGQSQVKVMSQRAVTELLGG